MDNHLQHCASVKNRLKGESSKSCAKAYASQDDDPSPYNI